MSDDTLLKALGKLARQQQAEDAASEHVPAAASAAMIQLLTDRALGDLAQFEGQQDPATAQAGARPANTGVAPPARRARWWAIGFAVPLAVAASALLYVRTDRGTPLPTYSHAALSGGTSEFRSGAQPEGPPSLTEGASFQIVLTPDVPVAGPLTTHFFWVKDGRSVAWKPDVEFSADGAVRARGIVRSPFGPGTVELVSVISRTNELSELSERYEALVAPSASRRVLRNSVSWR